MEESTLVRLVRTRFSYDPGTGLLTWLDPGPASFSTLKGYRIFKAKFAGKPAGSIHKLTGYMMVSLQGRSHTAHRLIWAHVYGVNPPDDIDHRDLCRANNRLGNLREATRSQNRMNTLRRADNTSGFKGVHWSRAAGKWVAAIGANKERRHLGVFPTREAAARAYANAAQRFHGNYAQGMIE